MKTFKEIMSKGNSYWVKEHVESLSEKAEAYAQEKVAEALENFKKSQVVVTAEEESQVNLGRSLEILLWVKAISEEPHKCANNFWDLTKQLHEASIEALESIGVYPVPGKAEWDDKKFKNQYHNLHWCFYTSKNPVQLTESGGYSCNCTICKKK